MNENELTEVIQDAQARAIAEHNNLPWYQQHLDISVPLFIIGIWSGLDQQQFNWILANAWKLDVKFIDHWSGDDETYVWPSKNPQTVTQLAKTFMKKGIVDYAGDIQVADAEEWPRTLAVRRG